MNQCDGCTLCCELFEVKELDKPAYEMCKHCDGTGCTIHSDRPQVCKDFDCAWLQSNAKIAVRPDKIGIVFEKIGDDIFHGTIKPNTELHTYANVQIMQFINQGFSVFIRDGDRCTVYPAIGKDEEEVRKKYEEGVRILHGGS